ncbi:hypothetical protein SAMN04488498_12463 [Mesorhizobium albiziae]|uniref:Uncharacterized protein n=2 Tax=Neomesorhizobium albiziae TaxID=335020 RepID=A0A1I4EEU3_9HYPH|nr:hypothetical protein GCM10007937_28650 [Mesorhizobium albiziae]SFL02886.1 hypothetical protein SAMN04488498_12463 [Mesorhizobium albiziae]
MPKKLPDLHQGHAPTLLHHAFHDALELLEDQHLNDREPLVAVEGQLFPVIEIFTRMLECTDLVPLRTRDLIGAVWQDAPVAERGDSYAHWARLMLSVHGERQAARQRPAITPAPPPQTADACACGAL